MKTLNFKEYEEDLHFENSSIIDKEIQNKLNKIIKSHEYFFIEFPLVEIQISKKSIERIFIFSNLKSEEKILYSIRINEIEEKLLSFKEIILEINKKIEKEKKKKKKKNYYKAESLKILKNPTKKIKKELNEEIKEDFKENLSDDDLEKKNLMSKFYPIRVSTDKQLLKSKTIKIKYLGFIGEYFNIIIFFWFLFYFFLIFFNGYFSYFKFIKIQKLIFSNFLFFSFFIDFINIIIGFLGIFHVKHFYSLKDNLEEKNFNGNFINSFLFFDIFILSFYYSYIFYFSNFSLLFSFPFIYDNFYKYYLISILINLILCFYTNLQIELFYLDNNNMISFQENLL